MSDSAYQWCEGYLAALCDVLKAEGASMEDWALAKTIVFDVHRREYERAAARFEEIAQRNARFLGLVEYVRSLQSTGEREPRVREPEHTPGFEGVKPVKAAGSPEGADRDPRREP